MLSSKIQVVIESFSKHNDHYYKFQKSLSEAQPVGFLITASLVIAAFLEDGSVGQQYTLVASLAFFLAYIGLHLYNLTEDYPYFYWAAFLVAIGFTLWFFSFSDVYSIIYKNENPFLGTLAYCIIISLLYVVSWSNLSTWENKDLGKYKFARNLLWASILFSIFSVVIASIEEINDFLVILRVMGTLYSVIFALGSYFLCLKLKNNQKNNNEPKRTSL